MQKITSVLTVDEAMEVIDNEVKKVKELSKRRKDLVKSLAGIQVEIIKIDKEAQTIVDGLGICKIPKKTRKSISRPHKRSQVSTQKKKPRAYEIGTIIYQNAPKGNFSSSQAAKILAKGKTKATHNSLVKTVSTYLRNDNRFHRIKLGWWVRVFPSNRI